MSETTQLMRLAEHLLATAIELVDEAARIDVLTRARGAELLTITETARRLGVSRPTVDALMKEGSLPKVQLGDATIRVDSIDLAAMVQAKKVTEKVQERRRSR